jgi:hypothetical protein
MYQLASESAYVDKTRLFVNSCTSMAPTPENMSLVRSATSLVRSVLDGADIKPLRDLLTRAEEWCADVDDVLAAAGQAVIDEMHDLSRVSLHDTVRRIAQIERDALSVRGPALRPVYAG